MEKKNLIYLGSDCYKMFCLYTKGMLIPIHDDEINIEGWNEVIEECDSRCKNIDQCKYWKT